MPILYVIQFCLRFLVFESTLATDERNEFNNESKAALLDVFRLIRDKWLVGGSVGGGGAVRARVSATRLEYLFGGPMASPAALTRSPQEINVCVGIQSYLQRGFDAPIIEIDLVAFVCHTRSPNLHVAGFTCRILQCKRASG